MKSTEANLEPTEARLLARFWRSASGFWRGRTAWGAWTLIVLLFVTIVLQLVTQYRLNFWNRDFFNAIEQKNGAELFSHGLRFFPLAGASLSLAILSVWARMATQRRWREWLSDQLYDFWLGNDRYRKLRFVSGDHQSPEFRIAEDARIATDLPIDLTLGLITSLLTAVTFIGVLWTVGGDYTFSGFGLIFAIPGYLVFAVVVYSLFLTASMMFMGHHLTRVLERTKRAEAKLRAVGAHLRESGEGTALVDPNNDERQSIRKALSEVIAQWLAYCWQLMRMTLISQANLVFTPVVALILCAPKYLSGAMTLGEVVQAAAAFAMVQGAFNWIADSYARLAEWTSSANRVSSLLIALDSIDTNENT